MTATALLATTLIACGGGSGDGAEGQDAADAPTAVVEAPAADTVVEPTAEAPSGAMGGTADLTSGTAATVPNTEVYYHLQTQLTESDNKCLEGQGGAAPDSGAVLDGAGFMADCKDTTGQWWKFVPDVEGYYRLKNKIGEETNLCAEGNRLAEESVLGGAFVMMPCDDVSGQLWRLVDAGDGYVRLQAQFLEADNKCLESQGGAAPDSGAVLNGASFMDDCQDVSGQYWRLVPQGGEAAAEGAGAEAAASANVIDRQAKVTGVNRPGDAGFDTMTVDNRDKVEGTTYESEADDVDVGIVAGTSYNMFMITQADDAQAFIVWSPDKPIWQDLLKSANTVVAGIGSPGPNTLMRGDDVQISVQEAPGGGIDVTLDVSRDGKAVATFSFVVAGEYPAQSEG